MHQNYISVQKLLMFMQLIYLMLESTYEHSLRKDAKTQYFQSQYNHIMHIYSPYAIEPQGLVFEPQIFPFQKFP